MGLRGDESFLRRRICVGTDDCVLQAFSEATISIFAQNRWGWGGYRGERRNRRPGGGGRTGQALMCMCSNADECVHARVVFVYEFCVQ